MPVARIVADILTEYATVEVECIERMCLTLSVPMVAG